MTRKEKAVLFRWSVFLAAAFALFWTVWSLSGASVPASDRFGPPPFGDVRLPFSVSRWWDVALAPLVVIAAYGSARVLKDTAGLGDYLGLLALLAIIAGLCTGIIAGARGGADAVSASILICAALSLITAPFCRPQMTLVIVNLAAGTFLLTASFSTGPFHAFLFTAMSIAAAAVSFVAARFVVNLFGLGRYPFAPIWRWLTADGVSDDIPVALSTPESARAPAPQVPGTATVPGTSDTLATVTRVEAPAPPPPEPVPEEPPHDPRYPTGQPPETLA